MKKSILPLCVIALLTATSAKAAQQPEPADTFMIPERAIVATGDADKGRHLVAVLYDTSNLHHSSPSMPRFLFLDREGKVALGIGGYVKGTAQYDFGGSIDDGSFFNVFDTPVPNNPAQRSAFFATVSRSALFLQLVGHSERFGTYKAYVQTDFSNGNNDSGYGLMLQDLYFQIGNILVGQTFSTFVDAAVGTPGIDESGPSGEMFRRQVQLRYSPRFSRNFSGAIAAEMPKVTATYSDHASKINQRVPDIPLWLQYEWGGGSSHVRLSGLMRNMSYRDDVSLKNRFKTAVAGQLSAMVAFSPQFTFLGQGGYGSGYGTYIDDLSGRDLNLVYSDGDDGKMTAPRMSNYELGLKYCPKTDLMFTAAFSQARVYGIGYLGGDTYRRATYITASGFYNLMQDLSLGVQYIHGQRKNYSGEDGRANRIMAMLKFSF